MVTSAHLSCTRCNTENPERAAFCFACGYPLHAPTSQPGASQPTGLLAPSHILNQRYCILCPVGQGGFGAVYKAEDTLFGNRLVAIKEMSQSWLTPEEIVTATEAFKHEALLLAHLSHPALPHIYDQFLADNHWYLVMDFIEGETLAEYLSSPTLHRLPVDKVLEIGIQLCTVLDYLHTRQPPIIFRDLKPANIMLTPDEHIFLIDFGIARHFKSGQERDTIPFGSPGYAPPEQYGKRQTTPRADIYSLGATLHQMLTAHDPAETPFRFTPLRLPTQQAPVGLDAFIMQMLSLTEHNRPPNMATVKRALQRFAAAWAIWQAQSAQPMVPSAQPGAQTPSLYSQRPLSKQSGSPSLPVPDAAQLDNTLITYRGHSDRVLAAAWSPDSKQIASCGSDTTIQVWDVSTGHTTLVYPGHDEWVKTVAWSPDGTRIASAGAGTVVQVWDARTGATLFTYRGHTNIVSMLAWSPNGKYIVSGGYDKTFQVWDATSGEQLCSMHIHNGIVNAVTWSPDGAYIATASDDATVQVWPMTKNGQLVSKVPVFTYHGHTDKVSSVAWSPNGKRIASGSWDNTVQVWDAMNGRYACAYSDHTSWINAVAWSLTSTQLASASNDTTVHVREVSNGREFFTKRTFYTHYGHTEWVRDVAWSPDGRHIASCGHDQTVQIWHT